MDTLNINISLKQCLHMLEMEAYSRGHLLTTCMSRTATNSRDPFLSRKIQGITS